MTLEAIEGRLRGLSDPMEREILKRHYIDGQTILQIAMDMHYSEDRIYKFHTHGRNVYHGSEVYSIK